MKKVISIASVLAILITLVSCSGSKAEFKALRDEVAAAGYEVSDAYVDSSFEGVVDAFTVKVYFDANTFASIPIILTKSSGDAKKNCELFGEDSIKLPMQNGKIFSYPGKDYPENVLDLVSAIVNGDDIPKNLNEK